MNTYAYIRVSTKEQNIDRQIKAIEPYKIPKQNIFSDYQSGKDFDRPAYRKMLKKLREGDLLIIKSIDRLGRIKAPREQGLKIRQKIRQFVRHFTLF